MNENLLNAMIAADADDVIVSIYYDGSMNAIAVDGKCYSEADMIRKTIRCRKFVSIREYRQSRIELLEESIEYVHKLIRQEFIDRRKA